MSASIAPTRRTLGLAVARPSRPRAAPNGPKPGGVPLLAWVTAVDPVVLAMAAALVVVGAAATTLHFLGGIGLALLGPAVVRWGRDEAIARHHQQADVGRAAADLEARFRAGLLDDEAYRTRRRQLVESAVNVTAEGPAADTFRSW